MTTSPFDSYRPPEEARRRTRRPSVRAAVAAAGQAGRQRSWLNRDGGGLCVSLVLPD